MSAFSYCMKTTADSSWKKQCNEIIMDITDIYLEYSIFDTDQSIVDSNSTVACIEASESLNLNKLQINE